MFPLPSPTPTILTSPIPDTGPYSSKIFISPISIHHLPEIFTSKFLPLGPAPTPTVLTIIMQHPQYLSQNSLVAAPPPPPLTSPMSVPKPPHRTNPPKIQTSLISVPNPTILTSLIAYNINITGDILLQADRILLCGDFNIHLDVRSKDTNQFNDVIESYGLYQFVQQSTHKSGHILDVVIASHNIINENSVNVLNDNLSEFPTCDHYSILFCLNCSVE